MADVDEAPQFAIRGKLRLKPTVVGLSKFNEAYQVAGRMAVISIRNRRVNIVDCV